MPILNNLTVNEIGEGGTPNYYAKLAIDQDGVLGHDTTQTTFSTNPATDINVTELFAGEHHGFYIYEWDTPWLTTVDCSDLERVSQSGVFSGCFHNQTLITSFDFSNLEVIVDSVFECAFNCDPDKSASCATFSFPALTDAMGYAFASAWEYNTGIVTASFPVLETAGEYAFNAAFNNASSLATAYFPALQEIGEGCFMSAFTPLGDNDANLTVTFGGTSEITLGADCFTDMFAGRYTPTTVYAPAANQAEIEAMSGYPEFGADTGTVTWHWRS